MIGRIQSTILTAILALAPTLSLAAEAPKLSVRVDREVAQVAEPVRFVLEVDAPRGTRVELPQLAEKLGDFEVHSSDAARDIPAASGADSRRWVLEATLETIKIGQLTIPPLDVHYTSATDATTFKTIESKPISVRITSVLEDRPDPTKFRDVKATVDVPVPDLHSYVWLGWTTAGVGGALAIALSTLAVVRRKRGPSPAEWALAAIADLEQLTIADCNDAEAAYNELVDVVREFFELEFNVPTLSRTTREFLAEATQVVGLGKTAREQWASLASLADEIKFARLGVGEVQVRQAFERAKAFVGECESHRRAREKEAA